MHRAEHFGDLKTADHKVLSEECESRNNSQMLSWYRIWPVNGYNLIRVKSKTSQETERITTVPRTVGKPKVRNPWNWANLVKIYPGIIVFQHRAVCRTKKGTSAVLLQPVLDEKWDSGFMECCCYLRNVQDLLSDGKTLHERRFGEPVQGPVILFWFDERISSYFCQRPVKTPPVR